MHRIAICPGSYDPVTLGHLDVIARSSALADEVVVAILHNPDKAGTFPVEQRMEFIRSATRHLSGVRVEEYAGCLLVDVAKEIGATLIVKGLRGETDYAYEQPMALMNRHLTGIETVFLPGDPRYSQVSSSLIKQVVSLGGDVSGLVTEDVRLALEALRD
ncbi:MAG TPA: pantetheine-phosphate adenylyltransferase [Intrasporangiaceae bacterium]|nr:pantetheine-phosphate adenylyltransferase [Intrasporangiaceae bacterium]